MFKSQKVNPKGRNPWRKHQVSKLPRVVLTKAKMVLKLVEVEDED